MKSKIRSRFRHQYHCTSFNIVSSLEVELRTKNPARFRFLHAMDSY